MRGPASGVPAAVAAYWVMNHDANLCEERGHFRGETSGSSLNSHWILSLDMEMEMKRR